MQNLREKLAKAGLVSEDQVAKAEATASRRARERKKTGRPDSRRRPRLDSNPAQGASPDDESTLRILRAIEQHRVRGDTRGEQEFHFELRDGRVRKLFLTRDVSHGLAAGRLAVVEWGEADRHIVVEREAVPKIRAVDGEAIRFFNDDDTIARA